MSQDPDLHVPEEDGGVGPYVAVLLVACVVILVLAVYVAGYRDEIIAILTQSPT
jgi:FlaG/FlaF family flagellin (archaellin)